MSEHVLSDTDLRLLESEERYRGIIDNSSDMIQSVRPDGSFEFVNQSWKDKLGYTEADLEGHIVWDFIHPDALDHCQLLFAGAMDGSPIPMMETVFLTKDGRGIPVEGSVASRMMGDKVIATHGIFRDISERLRAQELERRNVQLEHEQQARYLEKMAALGKLSAGLAHELNNPAAAIQRAGARLETTIEERNTATRQLLGGCTLDEALWQRLESLAARCSDLIELDPLERDRRESEVEVWLDEHDIDGGWKLAPGLVQINIGLADLDALSRELPPTALSPALHWIEAAGAISESVDIITHGSRRVSDLVQAIKGYTYMDRGLEQDVDLHDGIENTLVILNHRLRDMTIVRNYDTSLPHLHTSGSSLNQVWTNLLDNAIDATDGRGTITITTRRKGNEIAVDIGDNGPGIPDDVKTRIFEPFFTTKPQGVGTGLGLDTVWHIIDDEHHGTITVDSQPGETVFHITLPIDTTTPSVAP